MTRRSQHSETICATIAVVLFLIGMQTPAAAEVCDKVADDSWVPADGPVWLLGPDVPFFSMTVVATAFVLVIVMKLRWVAYTLAGVLTCYAVLIIVADLIPYHRVYQGAIGEGCRSVATDIASIAISLAIAGAFFVLGRNVLSSSGKGA